MDLVSSKSARVIRALAPPFGLRGVGPADVIILAAVAGAVGTVVAFAREFQAPFLQVVQIDLRAAALPKYTVYSLMRGGRAVADRGAPAAAPARHPPKHPRAGVPAGARARPRGAVPAPQHGARVGGNPDDLHGAGVEPRTLVLQLAQGPAR